MAVYSGQFQFKLYALSENQKKFELKQEINLE